MHSCDGTCARQGIPHSDLRPLSPRTPPVAVPSSRSKYLPSPHQSDGGLIRPALLLDEVTCVPPWTLQRKASSHDARMPAFPPATRARCAVAPLQARRRLRRPLRLLTFA